MGTSASLQPRPAFVGIGQGFTQWIAGQQSSIGHPGEERLYQGLGFGQPDILLFGAFQSLLANLGFHRIEVADHLQRHGRPLRIGVLALEEFPAGVRPALGMGQPLLNFL